MIVLNHREVLRSGEVRYHLSRQAGKQVLALSFLFPAWLDLPNADRKSTARSQAAREILKRRNELMLAVRGARGGC